jgi:hypothetical protein
LFKIASPKALGENALTLPAPSGPANPNDASPAFFMPLSSGAVAVYAKHLAALQDELVSNGSSDATDWPVVVTTDEKDPECVYGPPASRDAPGLTPF